MNLTGLIQNLSAYNQPTEQTLIISQNKSIKIDESATVPLMHGTSVNASTMSIEMGGDTISRIYMDPSLTGL